VNIRRILQLEELLKKKSFFLFGPRSTGKSFLIDQQLQSTAMIIDLLQSDLFLRLSAHPSELEGMIDSYPKNKKWIVIDEIQKIPALLDEVHRLIERKGLRFLLTGSSARKLKRGQANLLAGRAWTAYLFPLCWSEIPDFNLSRYLRYGGLPNVYLSTQPNEELSAYISTYIQEEIRAEGLIRRLPPFSRFLKVAALSSGNMINFAQIGSDAEVSASTVREYYSVLEDTLVGYTLEPWVASKKRKAIQTAKFYFFDSGVTHTLTGTQSLDRNSDLYGKSFEQFIGMELRAYLNYRRKADALTYWRSRQEYEVDYLIGDHTAIEVKATTNVTNKHLKGLRALSEEKNFKHFFIVSQDKLKVRTNGMIKIHWKEFLDSLWKDELFPKN